MHWFIDDGDDNDIVATKKDYIKDTNSYINICLYVCIHRKKEHFERAGHRMLCNHHYSNIIHYPILSVCGESITIYVYTSFTHLAYVSCVTLFDPSFSSSGKKIDTCKKKKMC